MVQNASFMIHKIKYLFKNKSIEINLQNSKGLLRKTFYNSIFTFPFPVLIAFKKKCKAPMNEGL
jgi:hypothetical protein